MIIGVHGIAQQVRGRTQLLQEWGPALHDGIEIATRRQPGGVEFDLAFYGHLFRNHPDADAGTGKGPGGAAEVEGFSDDESADLVEAFGEAVTPEEIEAAQNESTKGVPSIPGPLGAALRAIDAKFGPAAGLLYVGELRQVRRYLLDEALKAEVDAIVAAAMSGASILVGHSLGSVVAYEYVRQHPDHQLDLFVTVGSPLSLRMVRSRMPGQGHTGSMPPRVSRWVNVRDPGDPVAIGGDLSRWWPGVKDRHVHNGRRDSHGIGPYLSASETGSAIADALGIGGLP